LEAFDDQLTVRGKGETSIMKILVDAETKKFLERRPGIECDE